MPVFKVQITKAGVTESREIIAGDRSDVYAQMGDEGASIVSIEEASARRRFSLKHMHVPFLGGRVKMHDRILIAKNMSAMLDAGLAVSRAIAVLEHQSKNKKLKGILNEINQSLAAGKTFHESLEKYPEVFSHLFVAMVRAGEESGSLSESLRVVGMQLERSHELTKKIRGAMMYPAIVVIAMVGIGFYMLTNIIPQITQTFKEMNVQLPLSTRFIIGLSDFFVEFWYLAILMIIAAIVLLILGIRTKRGKHILDAIVLRFPIVGNIAKETNSARTARTMSSLLTAGVDILAATAITEDIVQNSYYKAVLSKAKRVVEQGEPLSKLFEEHEWLYPPFVGEMISVGEETGQMAKMLLGVAVYYETEVEQRTKDMSSIIEPFLMIVIGSAVAFFAVSMLGPIYSLGDAIQ